MPHLETQRTLFSTIFRQTKKAFLVLPLFRFSFAAVLRIVEEKAIAFRRLGFLWLLTNQYSSENTSPAVLARSDNRDTSSSCTLTARGNWSPSISASGRSFSAASSDSITISYVNLALRGSRGYTIVQNDRHPTSVRNLPFWSIMGSSRDFMPAPFERRHPICRKRNYPKHPSVHGAVRTNLNARMRAQPDRHRCDEVQLRPQRDLPSSFHCTNP